MKSRAHRALMLTSLLIVGLEFGGAACADRAEPPAAAAADTSGAAAPAAPAGNAGDAAGAGNAAAVDAACAAAPSRDDRLICNGRVGPVSKETARAALDTLFASARDDTVFVEGDPMPATVVNGGRADSAVILWSDDRTRALSITALGPAWHTPDGLKIGSTLDDLVRALGPKVAVLGFGWDYGGTVMLTGTRLENSGIAFRTQPGPGTDPAIRERVHGDTPYDPASADVRALKLVVTTIDVIWN